MLWNRLTRRRMLLRAVTLGVLLLPGAGARAVLAPFVTLSPISDGNPGTNELGYAGVEINATAFKNQSLVTVGDYQFTTFYTGTSQANHELIIGRRSLVASPTPWTLLRTGFTSFNIGDSHNVSTIGIDGDGFLHTSWGMHNHAMQYARSTTSVLNDNPIAMTGVLSDVLPLQSGGNFTYPEFYNVPDSGDLLFAYRTGSSGNGEYQLARWDDAANVWNAVHAARNSGNANTGPQPWIDNDFSSTTAPPNANAYHNGLVYDSAGRLHTTWTWRTGGDSTGGFTDFQSNHNVMYAYSDNHGVDWRLQDGTLLERNGGHDIDENNATPVVALPQGSSLINQASSAIGPDDNLYVVTWYAPNAASNNHTRQYMLLEYDGTTWEQHQVGARNSENGNNRVPESQLGAFRMSRPIVMTDDDNRVFVVYSDVQRSQGVTVAYSETAARDDWQFIDLATNDNMRLWEPKYDLTRWKDEGVLSMLYQPAGNGIVPTPVQILEWDARSYFAASLVLNVNRTTGAVTIASVENEVVPLSAYAITSAGGQLAPERWRSLADQGAAGFAETQAISTALAEGGGTPLNLAAAGSASLARPYDGSATAFRVDGPGDLVFKYTIDGNEVTGAVNYTGVSLNNLTLLVDPETGEAVLKNTSPFSVAIDGYSIGSPSGSLLPASWNSLDDQNAAGGDWAESNVNATALNELKPTSSLMLASGDSYTMGSPFNVVGGTPDLTFGFQQFGDSTLTTGLVLYTPVTPTADFDGDGDVDGGDFLTWQRGLGKTIDATRADGDADHDGNVDGADLVVWRTGFAASSTANAGGVPEPAASGMAFLGLVAVFGPVARLRR